MNPFEFSSHTANINLLLAFSFDPQEVKAWYLIPLVLAISFVYGGTRHETFSHILAHAIRSAIWLLVFLFVIFVIVWLSGFGTASEVLTGSNVNLLLSIFAWLFGVMWIAGHASKEGNWQGVLCYLSFGLYALYFGIVHRRNLMFPLLVMVVAGLVALVSVFSG